MRTLGAEFLSLICSFIIFLFIYIFLWDYIQILTNNIFAQLNLDKQSYIISEKIVEIMTIFFSMLLVGTLKVIKYLFVRPIVIDICMTNYNNGKLSSEIYHSEVNRNNKSGKIKLIVKVMKSQSLWNKIAIKLLKNKKIQLVCAIKPDKGLICQPESIVSNEKYSEDRKAFFDITSFILARLEYDTDTSFSETLMIKEDRESPVGYTGEFPLRPIIEDGNAKNMFFLNFFMKVSTNLPNGDYNISFIS